MEMKPRPRVSVLIPCYNEEKTIGNCLTSIISQTRKPDEIIVVNDGSTDKTSKVIFSFKGVKEIKLKKNTGNKSKAVERGLKYVNGDIVVFTDADTYMKEDFIQKTLRHLKNKKVAVVCGKVISKKRNLLTASREIEYIIGQEIHKKGQAILNSMLVAPGCGSAFKKKVLDESGFDHDTVTEDMDLTLKTHKLGYKMVFEPSAVVYTEDPQTLRFYIKQLKRWYFGFFQNLKKHKDILGKGWIGIFELPLAIIEGLFFGIFYIFFIPLFFFFPTFCLFTLLFDFFIALCTVLYGTVALRRYDLIKAIPVWFCLRIINEIIWLYAFVNEIVLRRRTLKWFRARK